MEARSALANQRRRWLNVAAGPAHAEPEILRGYVAELEGRRAGIAAIERRAETVIGGTHVEIAVGKFDREVAVQGIGKTAMHRPGEVRRRSAVGEIRGAAAQDAAGQVGAGVLKTAGLDIRSTDAGADERRDTPPGAEIGIDVDQSNPARIAALVDVGENCARERRYIGAGKAYPRAVLTGDIGTEPVVELVADAETPGGPAGEPLAQLLQPAGRHRGVVVVEQRGARIGHSDVASEVPATEILHRRRRVILRGRRDGHVRGKRGLRQQ